MARDKNGMGSDFVDMAKMRQTGVVNIVTGAQDRRPMVFRPGMFGPGVNWP